MLFFRNTTPKFARNGRDKGPALQLFGSHSVTYKRKPTTGFEISGKIPHALMLVPPRGRTDVSRYPAYEFALTMNFSMPRNPREDVGPERPRERERKNKKGR
ncbi:hypothetical protein EYR41_003559 [Orbilia oligospora]|uniref:Uncharacterized protein n=1 Tax=Orbilia oligospora TaxID=2813651 RepID=A0A7C8K9E2_ORBOL|nr:hypothetical protein TWF751_009616 [Orbilia oligospora]TGJ71602.1 hypothetical protein EYR41_003559 [Orbilia oligospora]